MMQRILRTIYIATVAVLFAACSNDEIPTDGGETREVKVNFSLSTRAGLINGTPTDPVAELEVERFNHYWVVFTDGTIANNVVAIVKNDCELTEHDEFMVLLSPGAYKVYGFANISDEFLEGLGIEVGKSMPDLTGVLFTPDNRFFGNGVTTLLPVERFQADYAEKGNKGIPMTSVNGVNVNITNAVTVDKSIEVVRMFAKIEFVFSNETGNDLVLRSQSVSNLSLNKADGKGYIPFLNDDERSLSFLNGKPFATLSHSYGSGLQLANGAKDVSRAFYVLESKADEITNSFMLDFNVVKKQNVNDATLAEDDYMRYGLTDPNTLTTIRRNDWIRIPIVFADWQMRLEAHSYPPIGGYPEAEVEETSSNEFKVLFTGGGDFTIRPFIRKFSETNLWFGIDNKSKVDGVPTISVDNSEGLFVVVPTLSPTGEINGRMNMAPGKKAVITVSLKVITNASPKITKTLTRKIFIIQK